MFEGFKARAALLSHQKGEMEKAKAGYQELYNAGYIRGSYILPWSLVLLREGGEENYKKVKEILAKAQKAPDMDPAKKSDLLMNFAVADYKLGNVDKALELMERNHQNRPCGNTFGALGYMYVDAGLIEKAQEFNAAALEYDDVDPVVLDNIAQMHYRLLSDKETALEYFTKAHELKPGQIDTLYFLAQYDIEAGDKAAAKEKLETALEGRFSPLNYVTRETVEKLIASL